MVKAEDLGDYYKILPDSRDLNYEQFFEDGEKIITESTEYNSHNTKRLNIEELKTLLLSLDEMKNDIIG